MKQLLIGCETIKEELQQLTHKHGITDMDFLWVDRGLHVKPEKLMQELQLRIDEVDGKYDCILLGYGYCGGGVDGLISQKSKLVVPKVSDCISLLLGSEEERRRVNDQDHPLFLTKGWAEMMNETGELNLKRLKEKYGEERARWIYRKMYAGYASIDVIDTGTYELEDIRGKIDELNEILELKEKVIEGDLSLLLDLLAQKWNVGFLVKEPGDPLVQKDFGFHRSLGAYIPEMREENDESAS